MDDDLVALIADQHDDFEKVAGGVRSQDQPPIGILAKVVDRQRVLDSVEDVVLSNIVAVRRVVDLHTRLAYYEIPSAGSGRTVHTTYRRRPGRRSRPATTEPGPCISAIRRTQPGQSRVDRLSLRSWTRQASRAQRCAAEQTVVAPKWDFRDLRTQRGGGQRPVG